MSFSGDFEEDVNRNMQEDTEQQDPSEEKNLKKHLDAKSEQEEDQELSEKKDRPPRFSTLFSGTPPPQIVERYIEQPRKQKRGIWIPLPLFILLAIILFFETTLLFAYTIIALDNNLGSGLFPISKTRLDSAQNSKPSTWPRNSTWEPRTRSQGPCRIKLPRQQLARPRSPRRRARRRRRKSLL